MAAVSDKTLAGANKLQLRCLPTVLRKQTGSIEDGRQSEPQIRPCYQLIISLMQMTQTPYSFYIPQ